MTDAKTVDAARGRFLLRDAIKANHEVLSGVLEAMAERLRADTLERLSQG